jgi:hypothetical protein
MSHPVGGGTKRTPCPKDGARLQERAPIHGAPRHPPALGAPPPCPRGPNQRPKHQNTAQNKAKKRLTAFSHVQEQERLLDLQGAALETHVPPLRHSGFYYIGKVPETPPSPTAPRRRATPGRVRSSPRFPTRSQKSIRPTHPERAHTHSERERERDHSLTLAATLYLARGLDPPRALPLTRPPPHFSTARVAASRYVFKFLVGSCWIIFPFFFLLILEVVFLPCVFFIVCCACLSSLGINIIVYEFM